MSDLSAEQRTSDDWCEKHRSEKFWVDCWNCGGEGYDCDEDCCVCLCDICNGAGGYKLCTSCAPGAFDD